MLGGQRLGLDVLENIKIPDRTGIRTPDRPIRAKLNTGSILRPCVYICVKV